MNTETRDSLRFMILDLHHGVSMRRILDKVDDIVLNSVAKREEEIVKDVEEYRRLENWDIEDILFTIKNRV